jgi:hypothetical protein
LIVFSSWLSSHLQLKVKNEFIQYLSLIGFISYFNLAETIIDDWLRSIPVVQKLDNGKFSLELFDKKFSLWYSKDERFIFILCLILKGIDQKWKCSIPKELADSASLFSKISCPFVSASYNLFSHLDNKIFLLKIISDYSLSSYEEAKTFAIIKTIASRSFTQNSFHKIWIAKSLMLISSMNEFTNENYYQMQNVVFPIFGLLAGQTDHFLKILAEKQKEFSSFNLRKHCFLIFFNVLLKNLFS